MAEGFFGNFRVFIISINICLYLTSNYSFALNLKGDSDRALGEYHFIISGIQDTMNSIYYREEALPTPASIESFMRSYADYYQRQNVFFELKRSEETLFSNLPVGAKVDMKAGDNPKSTYSVQVLENKGIHYLSIAGSIGGQYQDYNLTYLRDLSELYNAHAQLTRYLIMISALVETLLTLVLVLILKRLTRPISIMQKATRKIAGGVYDERVSIPGRDEFHDFGGEFQSNGFKHPGEDQRT